ncbi:SPOSA6832_02173, partial [Sporobolomyces salmonicolor]
MALSPTERALRALVKDYQSLNASTCAELSHTPSALEFHRFVAANRPVVIRGQGKRDQVRALERWSDGYLEEKMGGKEVAISVSPDGSVRLALAHGCVYLRARAVDYSNADAVVDGVFAEPATVRMSLSALFSRLAAEQALADPPSSTEPVYYLQSQNGNLADEYLPLLEDVGLDGPAWAREAFGASSFSTPFDRPRGISDQAQESPAGEAPEVANIWIGGSRSKTSTPRGRTKHNHKKTDPYENLYLVLRGSKTFTLLPPSEAYCVHERLYPHAAYAYADADSPPSPADAPAPDGPASEPRGASRGAFSLVRTTPARLVPWIALDPTTPAAREEAAAAGEGAYPRYALARPMTVTLEAGDVLYLPALWYHHVTQVPGWGPRRAGAVEGEGEGVKAAIAVNWWTDMKYEGVGYSMARLVRRLVLGLDGREGEEEEEDEGEP